MKFQNHNPEDHGIKSELYSQGIEAIGTSRQLHISGQVGVNGDGETLSPFAEQARAALANFDLVLASAGMAVENVVKLTIYLGPEADISVYAGAHKAVFGTHAPAITMITVAALGRPEWQVEIEGTALA